MPLHILDHPLAAHLVTHLRDRTTKPATFRTLTHQLSLLLAIEATAELGTEPRAIETPLEPVTGRVLPHQPLVIIPILRAGLAMMDGLLALFPEAHVGHVGIYRDEETAKPVTYYAKFPPNIADGPVILVDPMLATGGSAAHAVSLLKDKGCRDIRLVSLVAAPEGIAALHAAHPDLPIHVAAVDERLNERFFIVPGLGDAGDRIFGTQ